MYLFVFLLFPLILFAQSELEMQSMLSQANLITKKYVQEIAKMPSPSLSLQTTACLNRASVWFTMDLSQMEGTENQSIFQLLNSEDLWSGLKEIGVQAVRFENLKKGGAARTGFGLDPRFGAQSEWEEIRSKLQKKGIALIGDSLKNCTGLAADFWLALKNYEDYPSLYHLVEIEKADWKLLPSPPQGTFAENIPWLNLQVLQKKGYVQQQFNSYIKQSDWNATARITGVDGKPRRWIYLKENQFDPVLDWLDSSFAGSRIAAADALDSIYELGEKIIQLDGEIPQNTQETLALWIRKLGGFTTAETIGSIASLKNSSADLLVDSITRPALLHAILTEDAEVLKMMYRIFLQEEIEAKRLVHALQPFDEFTSDWTEFLAAPKKKYRYYEETLTAEMLRFRLLKEDLASLGEKKGDRLAPSTWVDYCKTALGVKEFAEHRDQIMEAHLLLAFFYALQPGAFSFSVSDLLGALPQADSLNLMKSNKNTLYASLPVQLSNSGSFACQLRKILGIRRQYGLETGELIDVLQTANRGVCLLVNRIQNGGMTQILAVNFGRTPAREGVEISSIRHTTAIDLMTGLAAKKSFESGAFQIELPPLSGKVFLFQPKYFD
ncbi:MAG: hypothetical protein V4487_06915 [Chlamydiota bacterium]